MGTGGLNIKVLSGLLERRKISLELVEGDAARDGCLLKLSSVRTPNYYGMLQYENQGEEPRLVGLWLYEAGSELSPDSNRDWDASIELRGARDEDPTKIVNWVVRAYLDGSFGGK